MKKKILLSLVFLMLLTGCQKQAEKCVESPTSNENKIEIVTTLDAEEILTSELTTSLEEEHNFPSKEFKVSETSVKELLGLVGALAKNKVNYCVTEETKLENPITVEEMNKMLKEINKSLPELKDEDIPSQNKKMFEYGDMYEYQKEDGKIYIIGACHGRMGPEEEYVNQKVTKAWKEDNKVYIEVKAAFATMEEGNYENLSDVLYSFSVSRDTKEKVETNSYIPSEWKKYNTYRYTYNVEDDNYILESITNIGK